MRLRYEGTENVATINIPRNGNIKSLEIPMRSYSLEKVELMYDTHPIITFRKDALGGNILPKGFPLMRLHKQVQLLLTFGPASDEYFGADVDVEYEQEINIDILAESGIAKLPIWQYITIDPQNTTPEHFQILVAKFGLHVLQKSGCPAFMVDTQDVYAKGNPFEAKIRNMLIFVEGVVGTQYTF